MQNTTAIISINEVGIFDDKSFRIGGRSVGSVLIFFSTEAIVPQKTKDRATSASACRQSTVCVQVRDHLQTQEISLRKSSKLRFFLFCFDWKIVCASAGTEENFFLLKNVI
jgi:hypothetical protein